MPSHHVRALALTLSLAGATVACQSYEARPLELSDHMDRVAERGSEPPATRATPTQDAPPLFDLSDGASLAECEALSQFYNADLRLARERAGVLRANRENAGLWEDPVFQFSGGRIFSPQVGLDFDSILSFTLPVSGRLAVERDRADAALEVELSRIVDAEWRVRAEVRTAYARWSTISQRLALLDSLLQQVERIGAIADQLEVAGALGRAQSRLIRIELVGRRAERIRTELEADLARVRVLGLIGLAPDAALAFEPAGTDVPGLFDHREEALTPSLVATNTELGIQRAAYRLAEETLRLEIREQYPDIAFGAGPGTEANDTRASFQLSLPVPLLNRNAQAIAEARAKRDVARVAAEVTLERIVREAERATVTLRSVARQRKAIEGELRPLLEEQSHTIDDLAELGDVDAFLLLETVGRHYDAASRLLELELSEAVSRIQLTRLVGPPADPPTESNHPNSPTESLQP